MKSDSVMRRFQESLEVTRSAKKQIWQVLVFLLIVAGLLYYVSTRALDVVRLGTGDIPAGAVEDGEDFFAEFRLAREKVQKEQMDLVKKVMEDKTASPEVRDEAHLRYLTLVDALGKELRIEGILKAKGLDSLVFLSGDSCTVVVRTTALSEKEVAQIGDAVKRIAKVSLQNITVIPTPK
ncbi:MAG: SpoIIIAH-like family protein [Bacillota bacterium]|jgi:stage III sporulation protein AH|nr:SpoIIIAH-like family protein [Candidatus Fermentithermobacillaceae bacterium]